MLTALLALALTAGQVSLPVSGRITSSFGWRKTDCLFHPGIDIAAEVGTPIHVPADGTVIFAGRTRRAIGMAVVVQHEGGLVTVYGHLSKLAVSVGGVVKAGEVLGLTGKSGNARGPHLHYEIHRDGRAVNPVGVTWGPAVEGCQKQGSGASCPVHAGHP